MKVGLGYFVNQHLWVQPADWMLAQIALASDFASQSIDHSLQRIQFYAVMSQQSLNERQLKTMKKLLDAGPKGYVGGMTTRKHQQISKTSKPTAARDLIDLEQRGLLVKQGLGRSTRYYPAIEGWAEVSVNQIRVTESWLVGAALSSAHPVPVGPIS